MALNGNIEMSQEFYMEVWNWYEKSRELEEENRKLEEDVAWYEKEEDRLREENKKLKEIVRDVLYRYTKHNIKNVIYKKEKIEIWNWGFDYNLDDYILS